MWTRREAGIALVAFLLGIAGSWLLGGSRSSLAPAWRAADLRAPWRAALGEKRVLVVVVGADAAVTQVRRAVSPDRVIALTPRGFALREGRIVVAAVEDAGPLLTMAGWQSRTVDIIDVQRSSVGRRGDPDAGVGRMAELMKKPTLTLAEAREALRLL